MSYTGQTVTSQNYNLFTKEERRNAQKELKAYLKGKQFFRASVFSPEKEKWVKQFKQVNRSK